MHTLTEWINASICTVWLNTESSQTLWVDGIPMPSWPKWWETWAWNSRYLTQIPKAQMMSILLAAWDAILKQYLVHHFWILDCYSCNLCGVPHLWGELNVPRLGEIEWQWQANGIIGVKTLKGARVGKGPIWVMRMQMWAVLLPVGVDRYKMDR